MGSHLRIRHYLLIALVGIGIVPLMLVGDVFLGAPMLFLLQAIGSSTGWSPLLSLTPASLVLLIVGLAIGHRHHPGTPWGIIAVFAVSAALSGLTAAWLATDPVQGGVEMPAEWVHEEFLGLLRSFIIWCVLPSVTALTAGMILGRWRAGWQAGRRTPRVGIDACIALAALGVLGAPAEAAWQPDGTVLSPHPQVVVGADGRGGIFGSSQPNSFAMLYHLDAGGDRPVPWPPDGIPLTPGMSSSQHASIAALAILPDGEGGAFVLTRQKTPYQGSGGFWYPDRYFVHRRTARGDLVRGWPSGGVCLSAPTMDPRYTGLHPPRMAPDGQDGVVVAWLGLADEWLVPRIVAQRVTAAGAVCWGDSGITLATAPTACTLPAVVGDDRGGALVFWGQWDPTGTRLNVRGQHVAASGRTMWDDAGQTISTESYTRMPSAVPFDGGHPWASYGSAISAVEDGKSGAILAWAGAEGSDLDIIAARVTPEGRLPWRRDVVVCAAAGEQATVACTEWQGGGAVVAWRDGREGADAGIFAQALGHDGRPRWARDGVGVALGRGERGPVVMLDAGGAGTFFAWGDPAEGGQVHVQRLLPSGHPAPGWPTNGWRLSRLAEPDYSGNIGLSMVEGPERSAIVAWTSWQRASFAMLVTPEGPPFPRYAAGRGPVRDPAGPAAGTVEIGEHAIVEIHPHPTAGQSAVRFSLSSSESASLELIDVAGRRVWSRDLGLLTAGEYQVSVPGGVALAPGVYLLRLVQGSRLATARMVRIR